MCDRVTDVRFSPLNSKFKVWNWIGLFWVEISFFKSHVVGDSITQFRRG